MPFPKRILSFVIILNLISTSSFGKTHQFNYTPPQGVPATGHYPSITVRGGMFSPKTASVGDSKKISNFGGHQLRAVQKMGGTNFDYHFLSYALRKGYESPDSYRIKVGFSLDTIAYGLPGSRVVGKAKEKIYHARDQLVAKEFFEIVQKYGDPKKVSSSDGEIIFVLEFNGSPSEQADIMALLREFRAETVEIDGVKKFLNLKDFSIAAIQKINRKNKSAQENDSKKSLNLYQGLLGFFGLESKEKDNKDKKSVQEAEERSAMRYQDRQRRLRKEKIQNTIKWLVAIPAAGALAYLIVYFIQNYEEELKNLEEESPQDPQAVVQAMEASETIEEESKKSIEEDPNLGF